MTKGTLVKFIGKDHLIGVVTDVDDDKVFVDFTSLKGGGWVKKIKLEVIEK